MFYILFYRSHLICAVIGPDHPAGGVSLIVDDGVCDLVAVLVEVSRIHMVGWKTD